MTNPLACFIFLHSPVFKWYWTKLLSGEFIYQFFSGKDWQINYLLFKSFQYRLLSIFSGFYGKTTNNEYTQENVQGSAAVCVIFQKVTEGENCIEKEKWEDLYIASLIPMNQFDIPQNNRFYRKPV